ncbi:hypothetical protein [Leptospira alstonii]|uniref:Uncharacterized protein n=1 Tax=Leptospira alstonii serovar Sichuan str. 79601 TaxID=1218565 RepID=M6CRJ3_9LEPT|nr:hypothetical protein [Leptospira alstonii]EMJ94552.1 hypothetical protein LEP1GSC194_4116 [Leptospira alstonii serovar Sichuan str. 79601]
MNEYKKEKDVKKTFEGGNRISLPGKVKCVTGGGQIVFPFKFRYYQLPDLPFVHPFFIKPFLGFLDSNGNPNLGYYGVF